MPAQAHRLSDRQLKTVKHVRWFFTQHLKDHSETTRYYYRLTTLLIWKRLGND
jgi:hypothetical protein